MGHQWDQPGLARRGNGTPAKGRREGEAMEAGRYDWSQNARYQAWCQQWATEALRVLKPGGHLLASGGTRTWHRLAGGIEDAGFELRDCLMWLYGSGFPKSKAALKPGWEPVLLARKPGPAVLNIDACRIAGPSGDGHWTHRREIGNGTIYGKGGRTEEDFGSRNPAAGRWPANVALGHAEGCEPVGMRMVRGSGHRRADATIQPTPNAVYGERDLTPTSERYADPDGTETVTAWACEPGCPVAELDRQSGELSTHPGTMRNESVLGGYHGTSTRKPGTVLSTGDRGGASRFFYTAKAAPDERVEVDGVSHPTQKPLDLVRWLVCLVTPPGGIVLDPFAGSFTTAEACMLEGFRYVAADRDPIYVRMAAKRTNPHQPRQHRRAPDHPTLFEAHP